MEKETSYQPTEEEIKKAEETMTDDQIKASKNRESATKDVDFRVEDDSMKIMENGSIERGESIGGYWNRKSIIELEQALQLAREAIKRSEDHIKWKKEYVEKEMEWEKQRKDEIHILEQKLLNLQQKQEEKK